MHFEMSHTLHSRDDRRRRKRSSSFRKKKSPSSPCEHRAHIHAFGSNYTLCLVLKPFSENALLAETWPTMNVTVFGTGNESNDIPIGEFKGLAYATGFVIGEPFTAASGFLMDDHFYGTVYMRDSVHYLEPHNRKSRDMKIYGEGLKTLLHKYVDKYLKPISCLRARIVIGNAIGISSMLFILTDLILQY